MQKILIILGAVIVVLGLLWPWITRLGLGRLPGDVALEKEGFQLFIPITSSIIISIVLTLLVWLFTRR